MAFQRRENFTKLYDFGCRIWVRPPRPGGRRKKGKLHSDSQKGIFLGYTRDTTKNVYWFDPATSRVKLAAHFSCDEMFHDLPLADRPPNVVQLERSQGTDGLPSFDPSLASNWTDSAELQFFDSPFPKTFTRTVSVDYDPSPSSPNCFGFVLATDFFNN